MLLMLLLLRHRCAAVAAVGAAATAGAVGIRCGHVARVAELTLRLLRAARCRLVNGRDWKKS